MIDLITGVDPIASWRFALAILFIVTIVVGVLLHLVAATARDIDLAAAEIWERGQRVANNTIHIAKAYEIRDDVAAVLGRAGAIAASAAAIRAHAESCPACLSCLVARR